MRAGFMKGLHSSQYAKEKGVNTQNYLFPGHHNTEYVQSNVSKYLEFYGSI